MDASSDVREFAAWNEYFRNVDVPGGLRTACCEYVRSYYGYKHGFTNLARSRLATLAEAIEAGDFAEAGSLLWSWGIR